MHREIRSSAIKRKLQRDQNTANNALPGIHKEIHSLKLGWYLTDAIYLSTLKDEKCSSSKRQIKNCIKVKKFKKATDADN